MFDYVKILLLIFLENETMLQSHLIYQILFCQKDTFSPKRPTENISIGYTFFYEHAWASMGILEVDSVT